MSEERQFLVDKKAPIIPPAVICHCRQVNRQVLCQAIEDGADTLEAIARLTGAGSECGSCRIYIMELLGQNHWQPVRLVSWHRYSENYCAFRFAKVDGSAWSLEMPGAYFIFQALIDGFWVGRPYAITDDGADSGLREITVKRKSGGFFSNWLFDHLDTLAATPLRISACMGGADILSGLANPIVCLVGGIGITPVMALCRTLAKSQRTATVHVDYSASRDEDFFCRDELQAMAERFHCTATFRQTSMEGRIRQADVDALIQLYPRERFFVCGPDSYKAYVGGLLGKAGVKPKHIIDLEYPKKTSGKEYAFGAYRIVGLLLLLAFFVQDTWGLKFGPLEQWQSQDGYKTASGLLLLAYLLLQWRLPIVRWLKPADGVLAEKRRSHQYFGTLAPLVFYLHATSIGTAYLAVLAGIYLGNSLLGFLNAEIVANAYKKAYLFGWTLLHVGLSVSLLFISGYHVYAAFAYK